MSSNATKISIQLDTAAIEANISDISAAFQEMETVVRSVAQSISNSFDGLLKGAETIKNIDRIGETVKKVFGDFSADSGFNIFKSLFPHSADAVGKITESIPVIQSKISNVFNSLTEFVETIGTQLVLIASGLFQSISNGVGAVAQMSAAFFGLDNQLLQSAATWISDTALKVANAAAQWAQVNATSAYNAVVAVATTLSQAFGAVMAFLTSPIGAVVLAVTALIAIIVLLVKNFDIVQDAITSLWEGYLQPLWERICQAAKSIGENLMSIWNSVLKPIIDWVLRILEPAVITVLSVIMGAVRTVLRVIGDVVVGIIGILDGVIQFVAGVFAGDWGKAWEGIVKIFGGIFEGITGIVRGVVNIIILLTNLLLGAIYTGIAGIVNGLGGIVAAAGKIVGKDWGFSISTKPPQIPYLAKGAVLPANKPFLAMVGDQKHGTNIEAPLSTIQEAVALVMEDMTGGMMAGFEANQAVLQAILEAIYDIDTSDERYAKAVDSFNRKMAVVRGG